jgi:small subunit ribosomal protein S4
MAKYVGPSCKICRREMVPLMLKGQRCLSDKCAVKKKLSEYGIQLREKQKIRKSYGLLERQFRRLFQEASRMKGVTAENMLSLLERRLDNTVYRMGFASSRMQARQFIQHRHILVDGHIVDIPSFRIREGAVIELREDFKQNIMVEDAIKLSKAVGSIPEWVEVDFENKTGKVVRIPVKDDISANFNEHMVVELYSK